MTSNGDGIRLADVVEAAGAPSAPPDPVEAERRARREFAALLGEFRRTAVLVPLDAESEFWTAEWGGIRWICAFSDEPHLAAFARARGEGTREWTYERILGARILDAMVPLVDGPCGVALDAGDEDGVLFPPVVGIVPDAVAVDA
ncbi:SseB family protein [Streptomyces sp. SYSU K217416]